MQLHVDGQVHSVQAPEAMPLLWVLRDLLKLKGTKFGCGRGLCGACTVHLDGRAIRSCSMPVSAVGTSKVTTIAGLSSDGQHPLQRAWTELDVPQCGYCQSGQIMQAADLLGRSTKPTRSEIDRAMAGNICRCGTYNRIRSAIERAAELADQGATPKSGAEG